MIATPIATARSKQPYGPTANMALITNVADMLNPETIVWSFGTARKSKTPQTRYALANIHA
jgi:hypothetical protein